MRPVDEPAPGDRIGAYVVRRVVACGGMSVIYELEHRAEGTRHAFKMIDPELLRDKPIAYRRMLAARARREGRIQREIDHPNVVRVTETMALRSGPGLVMELVDGPTLHDLVTGGPRLSWEEIDDIGRGLLAGLAAAHRLGVVHRDVKPANVLLECTEGAWVAKLADFGLAKEAPGAYDDELTLTGHVMGTVGYMPPEQASCAKHVGPRVDVFAAGAVLFEVVTGQPLCPVYQDADARTVALGMRRLTARKDLPDAMRAAVRLALSDDPDVSVEDVARVWRGLSVAPIRPVRRVLRLGLTAMMLGSLFAAFLLA